MLATEASLVKQSRHQQQLLSSPALECRLKVLSRNPPVPDDCRMNSRDDLRDSHTRGLGAILMLSPSTPAWLSAPRWR